MRRRVVSLGLAAAAVVAVAVFELTRAAPPTFASETASLDRPPPRGRAVEVSSASGLARALARARAGETIRVRGDVRVPGEFVGFDRVVRGGTVNVVLGPGVRFTGGRGGLPAVFVRRAGGWRIWGGTVANPGGGGILVYATPGPFAWTGFRVRDTGGTCVSVLPVGGDVRGVTLAGVAGTARPDLALDPHAEKGTGIHAWNIGDANGGLVVDSTFAADVVDQATGAAVEIDTSRIGGRVVVYARARHLGFAVPGTSWTGDAREQVAGNVVQLWGGTPPGRLDLRYVEGADIQGRILETSGVARGADLSRVTLEVGRATGPILLDPRLSRVAYAREGGIRLDDVSGGAASGGRRGTRTPPVRAAGSAGSGR
jgi:hypothetical protein